MKYGLTEEGLAAEEAQYPHIKVGKHADDDGQISYIIILFIMTIIRRQQETPE